MTTDQQRQERLDLWRRDTAEYKSVINLAAFAAERYNYQMRRKESYRGVKVLKNEVDNHKIVVSRSRDDGHWVYFSIETPDAGDRQRRGLDRRSDNGTIIDFIRHREPGARMAEIHAECRHWLGRPDRSQLDDAYHTEPTHAAERNRARVELEYNAASLSTWSRYLAERGLRQETLADPRFRDTWRVGEYGNVLFPHRDETGLSGFEKKNKNFTGFSTGGAKSLWHSRVLSGDRTMVCTEAAIDALSYHQLFPDRDARYFSLGGMPSREQVDLLKRAGAKLPTGGVVILAYDNDEAGHKLALLSRDVLRREGVEIRRHAPALTPGIKDWNDVVQVRERAYIQSLRDCGVRLPQRSPSGPELSR